MKKIGCMFICLSVLNACEDDLKGKGPTDMGTDQSIKDTTIPDMGDASVDSAKDSSPQPDVANDADKDLADTGGALGVVVPGERCVVSERIGIVVVEKFQKVQVNARLFDKPIPSIGDAVLSDEACSFYEFIPAANCKNCNNDQTCDAMSVCVDLPKNVQNASLKLSDGESDLTLVTDQYGGISGQMEAAGDTFSIELTLGDSVLTLPATTIPTPLEGVVSNLSGGYDNPSAMDLTWDLPVDPARVFTHVPINHHIGLEGTFTECEVDATRKSLHIDGPMLMPLAVATGLEFQTINHVRFAAAQIKEGCVEFRFQSSTFP